MVQPGLGLVSLEQPATDNLDLSVQAERERIANHLHDSMAQDLAFVHSQAAAVRRLLTKGKVNRAIEQVRLLEEVSRHLSGDVRSLIGELNSVDKVASGLDVALASLVDRFSQKYQIPVHYQACSSELIASLSPQVSYELYYIVQEALNNGRKHAAANAVWVQLIENEICFSVIVRDDGRGFRTGDLEGFSNNHYGLSIMKARARRIGARLTIDGPSDQGTQVTVCIPYKSE